MSADYTRFKGVSNYDDYLISSQILLNLLQFFNWSLIGIGAFENISINTSGIYGGDFSRLRPTSDPRYTDYTVYQGYRNEWIWESGITDWPTQPLQCSGVVINGTFHHTSGVGTYKHHIDFSNGRVVFDSPVSGATIQAEFATRRVPFVSIDTPYFRRIMQDAYRVDEANTSGVFPHNRLDLPAVGVEISPRVSMRGLELGGGQILSQDVIFHVVAETAYERNHISDILKLQNEKKIRMFDARQAPFPLDYKGSIASGAKCYPDLVKHPDDGGYWYKSLIFKDFYSQEFNNYSKNLYSSQVRVSCEIDMGEI